MPVFTFSGKDASGQKISGERMASNKQALAQALRRSKKRAPQAAHSWATSRGSGSRTR